MSATVEDFRRMLTLPPRDTYIGRPDSIIHTDGGAFYILAVLRKDGKQSVSKYPWYIWPRSLSQLMKSAKMIGAKPLYAVRVKMKVQFTPENV